MLSCQHLHLRERSWPNEASNTYIILSHIFLVSKYYMLYIVLIDNLMGIKKRERSSNNETET